MKFNYNASNGQNRNIMNTHPNLSVIGYNMFNRWLLLGFLCNTVVDLYNTSLFHEIFDCSLEYYNNSDNKFSNNFTIY